MLHGLIFSQLTTVQLRTIKCKRGANFPNFFTSMILDGEARVGRERFISVLIQYTKLPQGLDGDGRACASVFPILDLEGQPQALRTTLARQDSCGVDALRADFRDKEATAGAHDLRVETIVRPADQLRMRVHGPGEAGAGGACLRVE